MTIIYQTPYTLFGSKDLELSPQADSNYSIYRTDSNKTLSHPSLLSKHQQEQHQQKEYPFTSARQFTSSPNCHTTSTTIYKGKVINYYNITYHKKTSDKIPLLFS